MTHFQCHYESLKVTRDAPPEVIRAAYRSLSQKHHPDKNDGNPESAHVMARLNLAYKVLSDAVQRELYDMQLQAARYQPFEAAGFDAGAVPPTDHGAADGPATKSGGRGALFGWFLQRAQARRGPFAVIAFGLLGLLLVAFFWSIWHEQRTMMALEHAASAARSPAPEAAQVFDEARPGVVGRDTAPAAVAAAPAPSTGAVAAPVPKPAEAPAADKRSDYERLTALLKSMGLGIHKLDAPPARPAAPAPAPAAREAAAPAAPAAAAVPAATTPPRVAAAEPVRAREEAGVAAEPARAEAKPAAEASRASAAAAASADSAAPRQPLIVDARACAPTYPMRAYANGEAGTVQLELLVGVDGNVADSKVRKSSGSRELDKAARKALSQCRFTTGGRREPVWTMLEYRFSLD